MYLRHIMKNEPFNVVHINKKPMMKSSVLAIPTKAEAGFNRSFTASDVDFPPSKFSISFLSSRDFHSFRSRGVGSVTPPFVFPGVLVCSPA
ncbi:predicted protein [Arabidopsis lyrata subsp. lyrata]|uniref:Predicted protein n=1 Tax=Arabidopsis lyrata subsp. lyrata TaxID=81972 RepID=D7KFX3_ARALL|nr:predicted protein [Arabidopsis lyrata subsp. lyrata]